MTAAEHEDGSAARPRIRPYLDSAPATDPSWNTATGFRPFVLTAGRVRADGDTAEIGLETHVVARWGEPTDALSPEEREIVRLCVESLSVVEIGARLGLHLGVVLVLVGDLAAAGHLVVHESRGPGGPTEEIMLRVADGLRLL